MPDQPFSDPPPLPGNPFSAPLTGAGTSRTSGLAIASMVLGLLACPLSILTGIPGLVCGIIGLNRIARSERAAAGPRLTGQGMAIAGIILSALSMLILPVMVGLMLPAVQAAREAARRSVCTNNVRQLALAMLQYESAHGILPAAITDADGRPLLSWRVAILPFIEEQALYEQFHLDEPWDSEHNRGLLGLMPLTFACPSAASGPGITRYLLLDGPGTAFETSRLDTGLGAAARVRGVKLGELPTDSSETLLIVEAPSDRAVAWTKPEELNVSAAEAQHLEEPADGHARGIRQAAYADGRVESLQRP